MANYQAGHALVAKGRVYANVSATTTSVATARRVFRILVTAGTGAVTVYDNTAASGQIIWTKATTAVGDIYELDCPLNTGLTVTAAAATTVVVVYG